MIALSTIKQTPTLNKADLLTWLHIEGQASETLSNKQLPILSSNASLPTQ